MNFKTMFLPVGLIAAIVVAVLSPAVGAYAKDFGMVPVFVIIIFLVNGYNIKLGEMKPDLPFIKTFIWAGILCLGLAPLIALGVGNVFGLTGGLFLGLMIMSTVPPTLSSGVVITAISGGSVAWALLMTIGLNFAGIFTIPFVQQLCIESQDAASVDPLPLFYKLLTMVLVPFIAGMIIKHFTKRWNFSKKLTYVPSTCVVLTVWAGMSASSDSLKSMTGGQLLKIIPAVLSVHIILLIANRLASIPLKLKRSQMLALVFVASQKTLPLAISVITAMNITDGKAIVACIVFHFSQLTLDSVIATRVRKHAA